MPTLIPIALLGWLPFCLVLFVIAPRLQAVTIGVIGAWLILPPSGIPISGIPDYTKSSAFSYGILLGTLLFQPDRLLRFRPHWLDLPMLGYCLCPFLSSIANGLGVYDGVSAVILAVVQWGLPYLAGRLHFGDYESLRYFLIGFVVGTIALIPFCYYEMRMSPMLLSNVYGIGKFQAMRFGGYRPRVLFRGGLELGMWMSVGSLIAIWLWRCRAVVRLWNYPMASVFLPAIVTTTFLCRSSGALGLLMTALTVLWLASRFNRRFLMVALLAFPLLYVGVRIPNVWNYQRLVAFLEQNFSADRAQSLEVRFHNEDMLIRKSMQKPYFGWGGWGGARVVDKYGKDISVTDGFWIIELGSKGTLGLALWLSTSLAPAFVFVHRHQARRWLEPAIGTQAVVVGVMAINVIDCLLNAMLNSVYVVMLGGLVGSLQLGRRYAAGDLGAGAPSDGEGLGGGPATGAKGLSVQEGGAAAAGPPGLRLADRYIEVARRSSQGESFAAAVFAWRHALELLVRVHEQAPGEAYLARRRFDCVNDLAWFLLSRSESAPGDREEAAALARQAVQADPENPTYWNTLAAALCRVGDSEGAIEATERGLALAASAANGFDFAVLGLCRARLGRRDEAAGDLADAEAWRARNHLASPFLDALISEARSLLDS